LKWILVLKQTKQVGTDVGTNKTKQTKQVGADVEKQRPASKPTKFVKIKRCISNPHNLQSKMVFVIETEMHGSAVTHSQACTSM